MYAYKNDRIMNEVRGGAYGKIKGKGEGQADQAKYD